jgi:hypothetical protein
MQHCDVLSRAFALACAQSHLRLVSAAPGICSIPHSSRHGSKLLFEVVARPGKKRGHVRVRHYASITAYPRLPVADRRDSNNCCRR